MIYNSFGYLLTVFAEIRLFLSSSLSFYRLRVRTTNIIIQAVSDIGSPDFDRVT
jgi:hypothetical protein